MTAHQITSLDQLATLYPNPIAPASVIKEIDHIDANYGALIAASPFFVLATNGPEGLDCSPRGDQPGFVTVSDARTLLIPDRRGNNRLDSLKNLLSDNRIGMLFLIPVTAKPCASPAQRCSRPIRSCARASKWQASCRPA